MKIEFHPAAAAELRAAVDYYEEALPGLGLKLLGVSAPDRMESKKAATDGEE